MDIIKVGDNFCINSHDFDAISALKNGESNTLSPATVTPVLSDSPQRSLSQQQQTLPRKPNRRFGPKIPLTQKEAMENKENTKIQPEAEAEKTLSSALKISIPMIKKESKGTYLENIFFTF